ncbi:MAG: hypothetical protein M1438_12195 [Deltaproteobacteria bacterium]|nr:hypothetical protein [Deltaproteobacteria bacterium]
MQPKTPEDLHGFRAKLDGELQVLFQSLSAEWENTLKNRKEEDMNAFMAKWVEGVRDFFEKENIIAGIEEPQNRRSGQNILYPAETDAMLRMIGNLRKKADRPKKKLTSPPLSLYLKIKMRKGDGPLLIPASLKNLYQGTIIIEINDFGSVNNPNALQGKEAILHWRDSKSQETMEIGGIMTWEPYGVGPKIKINLTTKDVKNNRKATKILENSLSDVSKAHQLLWNLWDKTQETRESASDEYDQKTNFYLLLLACGTILTSFTNPVLYQTMHYSLSFLGLGKIIRFIRGR